MWQTRSSRRGRLAPSFLSQRRHIPKHLWDSIRHTEPDRASFPFPQHHRMSAEEFCLGLCDPRHTQSALRTIDRATDLPKTVAESRQSKQEYIQIQIEPLPLRSDGNDWIATPRQRLRFLRPDHALPLREIPISASYCRQMVTRFGHLV